MKLDELIHKLKALKANSIVVTGAHRSGTTIASKILASELDKTFIDEEVYSNGVDNFFMLFKCARNIVVQAPSMSSVIHFLPSDVAIVFMLRELDAIIASEARYKFNQRFEESRKYFSTGEDQHQYELKLSCFLKFQRQNRHDTSFTLEYESLRGHKLWIEDRSYFKSIKQTQ